MCLSKRPVPNRVPYWSPFLPEWYSATAMADRPGQVSCQLTEPTKPCRPMANTAVIGLARAKARSHPVITLSGTWAVDRNTTTKIPTCISGPARDVDFSRSARPRAQPDAAAAVPSDATSNSKAPATPPGMWAPASSPTGRTSA